MTDRRLQFGIWAVMLEKLQGGLCHSLGISRAANMSVGYKERVWRRVALIDDSKMITSSCNDNRETAKDILKTYCFLSLTATYRTDS